MEAKVAAAAAAEASKSDNALKLLPPEPSPGTPGSVQVDTHASTTIHYINFLYRLRCNSQMGLVSLEFSRKAVQSAWLSSF